MKSDYANNDFTNDEKAEMFDAFFNCGNLKNMQVDAYKCPHCESKDIIKYGTDSAGHQRFQCKKCQKIFINSTNRTPFHDLKLDKKSIFMFLICYDNNKTLKETAKITGISERNCFRLRHRFASFYDAVTRGFKAQKGEEVQVDGTFYRENRKGKKQCPDDEKYRKPRYNGHQTTHMTMKECVIFGTSSSGKSFGWHAAHEERRNAIVPIIRHFSLDNIEISTDGNRCYNNIEKLFNNSIHTVKSSKKLGMVNAVHARFRHFIRHFINVSSEYLSNYVSMFLLKENNKDKSLYILLNTLYNNTYIVRPYMESDFMQYY